MLKKTVSALMIIMTLILCGISSAAAVSELEATLRSDPSWDEYEIIAQTGDYAVLSSLDQNLLVTMDQDWQIIAWPDAENIKKPRIFVPGFLVFISLMFQFYLVQFFVRISVLYRLANRQYC